MIIFGKGKEMKKSKDQRRKARKQKKLRKVCVVRDVINQDFIEGFDARLPNGFQTRNLGTCSYAIWLLTKQNVDAGFTNFKIKTGYAYWDVKDRRFFAHMSHMWIELPSGRKIDPTGVQRFNRANIDQPTGPIRYGNVHTRTQTPQELLEYNMEWKPEFIKWCYKPAGVMGQFGNQEIEDHLTQESHMRLQMRMVMGEDIISTGLMATMDPRCVREEPMAKV